MVDLLPRRPHRRLARSRQLEPSASPRRPSQRTRPVGCNSRTDHAEKTIAFIGWPSKLNTSMRYLRVRNVTRGVELGQKVRVASSLMDRAVGLLSAKPLGEGEGLWLIPCK